MSHTHLQTFVPQAPPDVKSVQEDPELLNEYLQRMYRDLASNLEQVADGRFTDKRHVVPDKPRDGMMAYADGTDWNPGEGEGFYGYVNGAWVAQGQLTGAVLETLFDANTILIATTDDTPVAQTVADNTLVGRDASTGDSTIQDLTASEVRTLLTLVIGTDVQAHDAVLDATTASFLTADETKLDGIEPLAEVNEVWTTTGSIDMTSGSPTAVSLFSGASDVETIHIHMENVSITGGDNQAPIIQLGDSGGLEISGYSGVGMDVSSGSGNFVASGVGFQTLSEVAFDAVRVGDFSITLRHMGSNVWSFHSIGYETTTARVYLATGLKTLTGTLDRVTVTTTGGSVTFDGGEAFARYRQ